MRFGLEKCKKIKKTRVFGGRVDSPHPESVSKIGKLHKDWGVFPANASALQKKVLETGGHVSDLVQTTSFNIPGDPSQGYIGG